ncbi:N-6 DNA methylase [Trichocoleus sp. ST-U3]
MANESSTIVQKLWNYCNVLRDDGVSYSDYVEQLTYLLFLKMADEQTTLLGKPSTIPSEYNWQSLRSQDGDALEIQYHKTLENLGKEKGLLGIIFRKSQNKIQDPAKLKRLIELINDEAKIGLDIDVIGDFYEGLLQKSAEDTKSGAGQYFTPRALIKAIVEVMRPEPGQKICDPACGTGGFFVIAHDYISQNYQLDKAHKQFVNYMTFKGKDVADRVVRLCAMNLYLHGIGGEESPVEIGDSLISDPGEHFEMVLTNPPFGRKNSITIESIERQDFWATTSNNQLNFLQHVKTLLAINGKAAIVVPDNVLFEGGAGETVRRKLLTECDVHTLLRLPTGIFYAQGVKANVLFYDRKPASAAPWTKKLWIYDLRTNQQFTKRNPLRYEDLEDFIRCFNSENRRERQETKHFRAFDYNDLIQRDKASLDIEILDYVDINPPVGFKAVQLGDIADLAAGINVAIDGKYTENSASKKAYLLTTKDILSGGILNLDTARRIDISAITETLQADKLNKFLLKPRDILLARTVTRGNNKVAIIPDNLTEIVTYADSLIRVRVHPNLANAEDVFAFLQSDSGQISLQKNVSFIASIPTISVQDLAQFLVFLPEKTVESQADFDKLSVSERAARQIKKYILPLLEGIEDNDIEKSLNDHDYEVEESGIEKSLNDHNLEIVASKLRQLASTLAPAPLSERVMSHYPTPIALAYRRFHDSQFNVYEQTLRLRDLFESASFFVYNLVLSDALRRLNPKQFYIEDSGARRAYNGYSMSKRIDFVEEVIKIAKTNGGRDLFIPELVESSVVSRAKQLIDWRNQLSHTATLTESKQRKILDDYRPVVEEMLVELEFLANYSLVRIPSFYCKQGQLKCRMEIYTGAVPNLKEQSINLNFQFTQAEHNHLILLDSEYQILDLYPLYQLIDNEQTQYETHLCFFKQCKKKDQTLEGESVHNFANIELTGFNDFCSLQNVFLDKKNDSSDSDS